VWGDDTPARSFHGSSLSGANGCSQTIDPSLAEAWYNKSSVLKLLGRNNEADAAFANAKELDYVG
jgi:hypothetical protein